MGSEVEVDLAALKCWVDEFVQNVQRPSCVLLVGAMGAGKTQFVKFFIEALKGEVPASPTFAIHHRYQTDLGDVDHVDLYRLEDEADLESVGFWDLFAQQQGLLLVEWAELLNFKSYPKHWERHLIELTAVSETHRKLSYRKL